MKQVSGVIETMKQIYSGLIVSLIWMLSGCRTPMTSILTSDCQAPCWNGIVPGVTSKEDLLHILPTISAIDPKSIDIVSPNPSSIYDNLVVSKALTGEKITIALADDKVISISISGNLNVSFGGAIEKYGEPEYILVFGMIGRGFLWSDSIHTIVHAISPSKGIMFGYDTSEAGRKWHSEIGPGVKLDSVYYFNPDDFVRLADAKAFSAGNANAKETKAAMIPWSGYGKIGEKYPYAHK
jgi:hypothetical protein